MKKVLLLVVAGVLWGAGNCLASGVRLANEGKFGVYVKSIEQVLRLSEEDVDLAMAVLIISEQWNDDVFGRRYITRLDEMAVDIHKLIKSQRMDSKYGAIAVINEYLFKRKGFKTVSEASDPDDLFLHSVLDNKRGYCLSLSVLYLSLAERLGIPLYGVVVPGHFFVRYDDGQVRFNIETTSKGGTASDEHYINKFNVPEGDGDSIYMLNLNKIQTLGCFFSNLGNSYSEVGDMESARKALERAVAINPSLAESRTNLGNIYLQQGFVNDAIDQYMLSLEINSNDAKAHNNLGNAYHKKGWLSEASTEFKEAISLDAEFVEAYKGLALSYCGQEFFDPAQTVLREAMRLEPENGGLYSMSGDFHSQASDYDKAIGRYKEAIRKGAEQAATYFGMGVCYNKLGLADEAIGAYEKAVTVDPGMMSAFINLGNIYFARADYGAAIEQYSRAAELGIDDSSVYYNIGAAYYNQKDYERAVAAYRKAVEIDPTMGDAHSGLALGYYWLGEYEDARRHIEIAQELGAEISKDLLSAIEDKLK